MRSRRVLLVVMLFGMALITSCASHKSAETTPAPAEQRTVLKVDNQAFLDMTVYVLNGQARIRLGIAGGKSVTPLTIPPYLIHGVAPLRFLADPIGGDRGPVSEEIMVEPGDQVSLIIPS
jgi:hypothetical protein